MDNKIPKQAKSHTQEEKRKLIESLRISKCYYYHVPY